MAKTKAEPAPVEILLHVSEERMQRIKVGVMRRGSREGDLEGKLDLIAHFLIRADGTYLDKKEADEFLDDLEFQELNDLAGELNTAMGEAAVPNE